MHEWPDWTDPETGSTLNVQDDTLVSLAGKQFPIIDGIPRFVALESYADAFGEQWKRYARTQLDSYTGVPITRDRMRRCCGDEVWPSLSGANVLECGCGAGRFTEVLLAEGAHVTSIDLSSAVEVNQRNFPQDDSHRIAQADILKLPFEPAKFDVVVCLGVIQHTPDPELTIERLASHVRPGGWLVIDHYTGSLSQYTKIGALILRPILKRLSERTRFNAVGSLVRWLFPLHKAVRGIRPLQMVLSRLSPLYTYFSTYPELSDELHREWTLLDSHDGLTDWYKHFRNTSQIRTDLEKLGFTEIWCEYGGNGVEARGRKPA